MPGVDFDWAPDALELTRFSVWVNGEVNGGALPKEFFSKFSISRAVWLILG